MEQEKVWDEIAGKWGEFRTRVPPTVEKFLFGKVRKVLDVGCGSGRNFVEMNGVEWYGVDFSGEMLKCAEGVARKKGIDVCFAKASVERLPYEDEYFDAVLFYAVLHCVDSVEMRRKSLEEVYRVLKKGGEALISVWGTKSPRLKGKGKEMYVPWTVRDEGEKILRYTYVYDLDELRDLVESVGFEVIDAWEERNVNLIVRKR